MHGWLDTYHTFSFARYVEPAWMGFGPLRVINEDRIAGKEGFGRHFHDNMEIITYVVSGELKHQDNLGNGSVIGPGTVQYMSAGTGILHSEVNPGEAPVHLFQIWIEPSEYSAKPRYGQMDLPAEILNTQLLLASHDGRSNSIQIRQAADFFLGKYSAGQKFNINLKADRIAWLHVISGSLTVSGNLLEPGDSCGIQEETLLSLEAMSEVQYLLFDLPKVEYFEK